MNQRTGSRSSWNTLIAALVFVVSNVSADDTMEIKAGGVITTVPFIAPPRTVAAFLTDSASVSMLKPGAVHEYSGKTYYYLATRLHCSDYLGRTYQTASAWSFASNQFVVTEPAVGYIGLLSFFWIQQNPGHFETTNSPSESLTRYVMDTGGFMQQSAMFSDEYTTERLVRETEAKPFNYTGTFATDGQTSAQRVFSPDESSYSVSKLKYKVKTVDGYAGTVAWLEVFDPTDQSQPDEYRFMSWQIPTGVTESMEYTIDPIDPANYFNHPATSGTYRVQMLNLTLAVDADRDGIIKLASDDDSDTTTAEKPYRFWLNDDDDGIVDSSVNIPLFSYTEIEDNDIDVEKSHAPDSGDDSIDGKRDLEDLARLRIAIGELRSLLHIGEAQDGEIKLGLKWKIATTTPTEERTPSIRLFISPDALGTNRYLFDEGMASAQILRDGTARFGRAVGIVDANETKTFILPDVLFTFAAPDIQLLFEGVTRGRGEIQLVVLKRNQGTFEEIGQGPSVHLELERANQICHRWTCGDGDSTPPEVLRPDLGFAWLPASATALPDEERDLVLYVHGYNMSEYLKKRWIETTYKRLWHLGYEGHVGGFTWPTAQSAEQFANSEIIAWQSAAKLNELLVDLKNRGYRVHMLGHSLGNVVCAEALHLWREEGHTDALVRTYIASQAAIPAAVYNRFADTMPDVEKVPYTDLPRATLPPDVYARYWKAGDSNRIPETWAISNQSYSAKAYIQSAASRWVNFYNRNDYALSGFWEVGNRLKPAKLANFVTGSLNNQYDYTSETGFAEELGIIVPSLPPLWIPLSSDPLTFPVDRYEIFSFAAPAWSLALGTIPTEGAFTSSTNLASAPYGFGNEHLWHSGQFRSYNAVRFQYWISLLDAAILPHVNP